MDCVHRLSTDVALVGVVSRCRALQTKVAHDLVLSFSGHLRVGENHFDTAPACIVTHAVDDVVVQCLTQLGHERRATTAEGHSVRAECVRSATQELMLSGDARELH